MVKLCHRCSSYFTTALKMHRAGVLRVCNANRITVNDWRLLCLTLPIDQLKFYSESHTGNLLYCDSIKEGYQYRNEHV